MFKSAYRIFSVWGIPIELHVSLILVIFYVTSLLMPTLGFPLAVLVAVCLPGSILLHELGHSFVAIRKGGRVHRITLMVIGGAAQMDALPRKPLDEFKMAIAGPVVSITLGGTLLLAGFLLSRLFFLFPFPRFYAAVFTLGLINIGLGIFNLVPAFPMDGGRILRAALTPRFGRLRATFLAARVARIVAVVMALVALYPPFQIILLLIAVFIYFAAGREYAAERLQAMGTPGIFQTLFGDAAPWNEPPPDENEVTISPPPYENRRASRAELETDEEDPFTFFGP